MLRTCLVCFLSTLGQVQAIYGCQCGRVTADPMMLKRCMSHRPFRTVAFASIQLLTAPWIHFCVRRALNVAASDISHEDGVIR